MDPNPGMPVTRKKHVAIERLWDGHFPITCGLLRYRILTYSRRLGAMAALQTELGWVKIGQKSKLYIGAYHLISQPVQRALVHPLV